MSAEYTQEQLDQRAKMDRAFASEVKSFRRKSKISELKERIQNQHEELRRVAEFAQCIAQPVEYEDDTIYLQGIKESSKIHRQEIDRLKAELKKYEEGVEVTGVVSSDRIFQNLDGYKINLATTEHAKLKQMHGQPVIVNVRVKE